MTIDQSIDSSDQVAPVLDRYQALALPNAIVFTNDLYSAYAHVCETKGLKPLALDTIHAYLSHIRYLDHTNRHKKIIDYVWVDGTHEPVSIIKRIKFDRVGFISGAYDGYKHWGAPIATQRTADSALVLQVPSNFSIGIALITLGDIIMITWVVVTKYQSYSIYLLLARSGAAIILYNLGLLLIHISNVLQYIDHSLVCKLSTNESGLVHRVLGLKIMFGTAIHVLGHGLHVNNVLHICVGGCNYDDVHTIPQTNVDTPIVISWGYFMKLPAYYSGIALVAILILMSGGLILSKIGWLRPAWFYNQHRLLAIICSIGIILHGVQQVLGFNLSYIFVLPSLLVYLASRYSEILYTRQLEVTQWHITDSVIRIYCNNTPYLTKQLEYGVAVSAYINHRQTSRLEWHPFTIFATTDTESCISIKGSGKWTKAFIQNMLTSSHSSHQLINLGHILPSCFRFHKFYLRKIIFCSGIGITPFLSIVHDVISTGPILLIWSINSMEMIQEFIHVLRTLGSLPKLQVVIFYSNSSKGPGLPITTNQWHKFDFLQTLIHHHLQIDIIHGNQIPWMIILDRANPFNIIARSIKDMPLDTHLIGIFVCGGPGYTHAIRQAVETLRNNSKKIRMDVWAEHLWRALVDLSSINIYWREVIIVA